MLDHLNKNGVMLTVFSPLAAADGDEIEPEAGT